MVVIVLVRGVVVALILVVVRWQKWLAQPLLTLPRKTSASEASPCWKPWLLRGRPSCTL